VSRSLRQRLVTHVLGTLAPVVAGLTVVLYLVVERAIWDTFDRELESLGTTYAGMVEYDVEDGYEFEPAEAGVRIPGTHLQIWLPDGTVLARQAPGEGDLEIGEGTEPYDGALPDGTQVRFVTRRARAFVDPAETEESAPAGAVTVVVGRETSDTRAMLATLVAWFLGLGLTTLGVASLAAWRAVVRGLAPVSEMAARIEGIDADALGVRIPEGEVPAELAPVARRLNDLLGRLQSAFQRERRFTADVAHELRTPLSILQTTLELALRTDRPAAEYRQTLADALETTQQTAVLVENLLMLARLDADGVKVSDEEVMLRSLVESCWAPYETTANEGGLEMTNEISEAQVIVADRGKLRLIASNLLGNAAEYTEQGGWIRVTTEPASGVILAVTDSGPPIPEETRERLFSRFWRGDEARSDAGVHCGIGLSLVQSLCDCLGYTIEVESSDSGPVAFVVRGPPQRDRAPVEPPDQAPPIDVAV
jgi:two-component system sensor histidine kinase QseC